MVGTAAKPWMMLKEISSNGNCQTVDVIYPHFPVQLYLNPTLLRLLMEPLLDNQERGFFPKKYCIHDLGTHYPRCIGHTDGKQEDMEVEESANMVIMMSAYVRATNDKQFAQKHYNIAEQWTQYLVDNGLITGDALTTDDFLGTIKNSTNLSLKAIIGIGAMAQLAEVVGNHDDQQKYRQIAEKYVTEWIRMGEDPSNKHMKLSYNDNNTWFMIYNLYADVILDTKLVPESIYKQQDEWYLSMQNYYGLPLESGTPHTKFDWVMFTAAASTNAKLRQSMFDRTAQWLRETPDHVPFSDWVDTQTGGSRGFKNRPVIGGSCSAVDNDVLPAVPLVVKSPYLSTWMTSPQLMGDWPRFWNGNIKGMAGLVRVNGQTYEFMGHPTQEDIGTKLQAKQVSLRVTPTQSIFTFNAGPIALAVNFFTPIDPTDLKRLSLPASYISVSAWSLDSATHEVEVYLDITGEWTSGDSNEEVVWDMKEIKVNKTIITGDMRLKNQKPFEENNESAQWGTVKFFTDTTVTHEV
ncbi:unnamed protein product [Oppiella nova]|uniref:DUF1793-domain-containing protein n=1 Tax=Oppiella nova TaxID=334625 RepID=A0A7R9LZU7_9ACAR|nr:unnamed protein product [Oppiella nova]CAG2168579.1 unnamed protein product [Oppiella nova]